MYSPFLNRNNFDYPDRQVLEQAIRTGKAVFTHGGDFDELALMGADFKTKNDHYNS